jgi:putative effector of murein hydrolase
MAPRSITLALALPIADRLDAPPSITAAAVALTGIVGANLVLWMMGALQLKDPIARWVRGCCRV